MNKTAFGAWWRKKRIGVLMGGLSAERTISLKTGRAILASLRRQKLHAVAIDAGRDLARDLKQSRINFAYIALHGPGGEDGAVQGLLEWMGIPYTGSGVLASAAAMDKAVSKRLFQAAGLPLADGFTVTRDHVALPQARKLGFPLVVKPTTQGSAIGVSIVRSARQLPLALRLGYRYGRELLIERFLDGPEITVGVLGDRALPIIEILPMAGRFYDFKSKYAPGGSRHILPARLTPAVAKRSQAIALAAAAALGTKGAVRADLIVDKKRGPTLLEVNTIPGMTETSLLPEAARAAGLDFDALVWKIAELSVVA